MVGQPGVERAYGKTLLAAWRLFFYKLSYHTLGSIPLKRWLWALVALPPLVAWLGQLGWAWAVSLSGIGAAALVGAEGARRRQYVLFDPAQNPGFARNGTWPRNQGSAGPLGVDEPLRCWASGRMGVEGKKRPIAGERASVSWVGTREHVVMAQVRRSRFLLLAPARKEDTGYWYAFFHPRCVQAVHVGTLYCGFTVRPGLALSYTDEERDGQPTQLYLGFEDARARQRLLDDLRRDVDQEAFGSDLSGPFAPS
jgi:hypothetical protein